MHVLTKVLVALTALASVALATLTMAYTVNADRIVNELRTEQAATAAAKAAVDTQAAGYSIQIESLNDEILSLESSLNDQKGQVRSLEVQLAKVEGEKAEAERARAAIQGELGNLATSVQTFVQLTSTLTNENDDLRDRFVRQNEELIQLADRLNDEQSRSAVLDATVRQLEIQIRQIQGSQRGSATPSDRTGPVQGTVRDVAFDSGSDRTLVEVNLGTNDGVAPGTELRVTRQRSTGQDMFVARLRTMTSDLNISTAEVILGESVQRGDRVEIQ